MANFIGLVYATLKQEGIDTAGMSTDEAVAKYNELQKSSGGKSGEKEGTPAEQKALAKMEEASEKVRKTVSDKDWSNVDSLTKAREYDPDIIEKQTAYTIFMNTKGKSTEDRFKMLDQMGDKRYGFDIDKEKVKGYLENTDESVGRKSFKNWQEMSKAFEEDIIESARREEIANNSKPKSKEDIKKKQLEIINKNNPMTDDYHTGIRSVEDIKTFDEVIDDDESFVWGDFEREDAEKALKSGKITIYSSYPIGQGTFVSTSKIQAEEYAGGVGKKIYSKEVPLSKVAWINGDEGQFADVD